MTQHAELTMERWSAFGLAKQLLQIAAEMQRGTRPVRTGEMERVRAGYERVLRLVDLTVQSNPGLGLRRELLRWRGVVGELYVSDVSDPERHRLALRVLLRLHPESSQHVQFLDA